MKTATHLPSVRPTRCSAIIEKTEAMFAEATMHAVSLQLAAKIPFECELWCDADGWTGACQRMSVSARGGSFEDAKQSLETVLRESVERILSEHLGTSLALGA